MRSRRVGVLGFSNLVSSRAYRAVLANELAKLGWVDGQNIQLIYRFADGDAARLPALAAELVALEPDALFGPSGAQSLALAHATSRIPVVMAGFSDPVAAGLVKSLTHPGGNVTGCASWGPETFGKRLQLLQEWLPRMSRIALIYNPGEPGAQAAFVALEQYANRFGVRIESRIARDLTEIRAALDVLSRDRPDAVYLANDASNYTNRELVCAEVTRMRLPTMTDQSEYPAAGCLASYSYSLDEITREAVRVLDEILRGARPADIPVREPTRSELVINARTAALLGLAIPPRLRLLADRVIE
jgi:putative ABC transport system substrate-binding protein